MSLHYLWHFDDGTTSSEQAPRKTFTAEGTRKFNVVLRVTDSAGASDSVTVQIFVNHAPPDVLVIAPQDGAQYRVGNTAVYPLRALITPQPGYPATSTWQTILHHDTHVHRDAPVDGPDASVLVGGEGEGFFYENVLTVTDDLGLSVTQNVKLRPALSNAAPSVAWSITQTDVAVGTPTLLDHAARVTDKDSAGLEDGTLRVDLANGTLDETLAVRSKGAEPGQISVTDGQVNFGGVPIGTIEITDVRFPLTVVFNAAATPAAATALLRSITYASTVARTRPQMVRVTLSDGDGGVSAAADLSVTPRFGNLAPSVRIVSPAFGALFNTSSNVPVIVAASDPDGTVARVDFFRGSTRIGSATSPPFEFTWFDVPARTFNLRARAVDNAGANSWSLPVQIRVTTPVSTLLADNFDDNARDNRKWSPGSIVGTLHEGAAGVDSDVALAERNQHLDIPLRSGIRHDIYYGYVAS
jgi:PKD repeat protein